MKYFAYGSNMLTQWLTDQARAPSAVACGIARAPGFVVRFHKASKDKSGKCALIATADEAAAAYGVLYEVSDVDGDSLDRAERGLQPAFRAARARRWPDAECHDLHG